MELKPGKTYLVDHTVKGIFMVEIFNQCDTWTHGRVKGGTARAVMPANVKYVGDDIRFRSARITKATVQL